MFEGNHDAQADRDKHGHHGDGGDDRGLHMSAPKTGAKPGESKAANQTMLVNLSPK